MYLTLVVEGRKRSGDLEVVGSAMSRPEGGVLHVDALSQTVEVCALPRWDHEWLLSLGCREDFVARLVDGQS